MEAQFGPYVIKETLGGGGFSEVKLGVHESTGEKVALKILNAEWDQSMEREMAIMKKLNHLNVLSVKNFDSDIQMKKNDKSPYVIPMELASGGELYDYLASSGCFEESLARTYFHQLSAGLEHCHAQGIVHGDLKPENLLLGENFTLKIADFGFSYMSTPSERIFVERGSTSYMAPEIFQNKGYNGFAADIWALGVILFMMLSAYCPLRKAVSSDWYFDKLKTRKHANFWQRHSRCASFSEQAKDLINKILNPDPVKRITIAAIKKHPWWNGPTLSRAALITEMESRKSIVNEHKKEVSEEKQAKC